MGLNYANLSDAVRQHMAAEIDSDSNSGAIYISNYLNDAGQAGWAALIKDATLRGNDDTLAGAIRAQGLLKRQVERRKPKGGTTLVAVPVTAHETLGEGEFNRYYCRGLCLYAIENGIPRLEVYRAKPVAQPRAESEAKLGALVDPAIVLADLRATQGVEPALGLPPGPNSGLTLRVPA